MEPPQYLHPVELGSIQDQDLDNVLNDYQENAPAIYHEMEATSLPPKSKTSWFFECTEEKADEVEMEKFKDKTLKKTVWGVKIFRGNFTSHSN